MMRAVTLRPRRLMMVAMAKRWRKTKRSTLAVASRGAGALQH